MLDLNVYSFLCYMVVSITLQPPELLMLLITSDYKFIRPKTTSHEVCVDTLRNKHLHDNNSDGTECPTSVGTNNEPNKIKAINYSRSIKVTITCKVEHLTCFVTSIHWLTILLESGIPSQCNETIETDFGVSKISQKQNRSKTKQTH